MAHSTWGNEGIIYPDGMKRNNLDGAGSDELPFEVAIADRLLPVASVVGASTVPILLEIVQSSSFDLKDIQKHVLSCTHCKKIAQCVVEQIIVENGFENQVIQKMQN